MDVWRSNNTLLQIAIFCTLNDYRIKCRIGQISARGIILISITICDIIAANPATDEKMPKEPHGHEVQRQSSVDCNDKKN